MKKKEMLIAGSFYTQAFDLTPAKLATQSQQEASKTFFKELTEKVSQINPDFTFDYSRHPALTVLKNGETIAVLSHPDPAQRKQYLVNYCCAAALYNNAFNDKETLEDTKKVLELFRVDFKDMRVRDEVIENRQIYTDSLTNLRNGKNDYVNYANLRDLHIDNQKLVENFIKVNGYEKRFLDGDKVNNLSEQHDELLRVDPSYFSIESIDFDKINQEFEDMKEEYKLAKAESDNAVPSSVSRLNAITQKMRDYLREMNDRAKEEKDFIDVKLEELDFMYKKNDSRLFKNYPYIAEYKICNKYNTELVRYKAGFDKVNVNSRAALDDKAIHLAIAIAIKKDFKPITFKIHQGMKELYKDDKETLAKVAHKVFDQIIAQKPDIDLDTIIFPKEYDYLIKDRKKLMEGLSITSGNKEEIAEHNKKLEEERVAEIDAEIESEKAVVAEAPTEISPVEQTTESVVEESVAVAPTEKPAESTVAEPVIAKDEKAVEAPVIAPAAAVAVATVAESVPVEVVEKPKIQVINKHMLVKSATKDTYTLINLDRESTYTKDEVKKIVGALCSKIEIEPALITSAWYSDKVLAALQGGKKDPKDSYKIGFEAVNEMKSQAIEAKLQNEEKQFFADNIVEDYVVSSAEQFSEFNITDNEKRIAELFNQPSILESDEFLELVATREAAENGTLATREERDEDYDLEAEANSAFEFDNFDTDAFKDSLSDLIAEISKGDKEEEENMKKELNNFLNIDKQKQENSNLARQQVSNTKNKKMGVN